MMVLHFWQSISIYSVMLAPTLQVLGGGTSVLLAMVYSLIADAVSESTRYVFASCGMRSLSH